MSKGARFTLEEISKMPERIQRQIYAENEQAQYEETRAALRITPLSQVSHPESQHYDAPALGSSAQRKTAGMARTTVRFVGYRVKPLDPDGFAASCKGLLDGLRHSRLIEGDEPWRIRLETEQERVDHFSQERTEIVIEFAS